MRPGEGPEPRAPRARPPAAGAAAAGLAASGTAAAETVAGGKAPAGRAGARAAGRVPERAAGAAAVGPAATGAAAAAPVPGASAAVPAGKAGPGGGKAGPGGGKVGPGGGKAGPGPNEPAEVRPAFVAAIEDGRDDSVPAGQRLRAARADLRRQLREQKRLRIATLVAAALLLAGALPLYFAIQAATRDPVLRSLDALSVPGWASTGVQDRVSGSRWCLIECRFRERTVQSSRDAEQTAPVYEDALKRAGWVRWSVQECPGEKVDGSFTCWRRDELTLDLWVRKPQCAQDPLALRPTVGPTDGGAPAAPADPDCTGSVITLKVRNYIDDERRHGPAPTNDPGLTGEVPDPLFSDQPTPGPT